MRSRISIANRISPDTGAVMIGGSNNSTPSFDDTFPMKRSLWWEGLNLDTVRSMDFSKNNMLVTSL